MVDRISVACYFLWIAFCIAFVHCHEWPSQKWELETTSSASVCKSPLAPTEYSSLQRFYESLHGKSWYYPPGAQKWSFSTTNYSAPCNGWYGIQCTCVSPSATVTTLRLSRANLTGVIPAEIENLKNLSNFIVDLNRISGSLPSEMGSLAKLVRFNMTVNKLTGSLPLEFSKLLLMEEFSASNNSLVGSFPSQFSVMSKLRILFFTTNSITGVIPDDFSTMTHLQAVSFGQNSLRGTIPSFFGTLTGLSVFVVGANSLSGSIPPTFSALKNLTALQLLKNSLTGTIPSFVCSYTKLISLYLGKNRFEGTIPNCIGNFPHLRNLALGENNLHGTLPTTLAKLSELELLSLSLNRLSGPFIPLDSMSRLIYLVVYNNTFTGPLPSKLFSMKSLLNIWMAGNRFTGTLPPSNIPYVNLQNILLQSNSLTGKLAEYDFSKFGSVTAIDISNNLFSGSFPSQLFKFPYMKSIAAVSNCFTGSLPSSICLLKNWNTIQSLNLDGLSSNENCPNTERKNSLKPSFMHGFLQANSMSGTIPSCVFQISSLSLLHMSGNGFGGTIPDFEYNSSALMNVTLSNNQFSGTIPDGFQKRRYLNLDLSVNRLTGTLNSDFDVAEPNTLLMLHTNRLSGELPNGITNTSYSELNVLVGNLFECAVIPTNDVNYNSYSCGSVALDNASYTWATIFGLLLLAVFVYYWVEEIEKYLENYLTCLRSFASHFLVTEGWWQTQHSISSPSFKIKMPHTILTIYSLKCCTRISILLISIVLLVLIPVYTVTKSIYGGRYSTIYDQSGWIVSSAFFHDFAPVILISLVVIATTVIYYLLALRWYNISKAYLEVVANGIVQSEVVLKLVKFNARNVAITLALQIVNIVVTVSVNAAYVSRVLSNVGHKDLFVIQSALGAFKLFWNLTYISYAAEMMPITSKGKLGNRLFMSIFSYIAAPCVATITLNRACFYNIFVLDQNVPSEYDISVCVKTTDIGVHNTHSNCTTTYSNEFYNEFSPPFFYSYQCSSNLITSFVPVLLYTYILSGVVLPTVYSVLSLIQHNTLQYYSSHLYKLSSGNQNIWTQRIARFYNSFSAVALAIGAKSVTVTMTQDMTVLMTFGITCPVLAVAIACSTLVQNIWNRLMIGKEVYFAVIYSKEEMRGDDKDKGESGVSEDDSIDPNSRSVSMASQTTTSNPLLKKQLSFDTLRGDNIIVQLANVFDIISLEKIEEDAVDAWKSMYGNVWLVVFSISFFWGLMFFDMVADIYGDYAGISIFISFTFGLPLIIFICKIIVFRQKIPTYFFFDDPVMLVTATFLKYSEKAIELLGNVRKNVDMHKRSITSKGTKAPGLEMQSL